jgi:adenylate cyclase
MAKDRLPDKLVVILHADVAGSTQLVQQDEHLAHERIQDSFRRFSDIIEKYRGSIIELRGDALLAEFERASDAVTATLAFQSDQAYYLSRLKDDLKPSIRVGIAMGEIVMGDGTVTGAGVVLAQRIEQLADPGSLCITAAPHEIDPQQRKSSVHLPETLITNSFSPKRDTHWTHTQSLYARHKLNSGK